jgi:hypothetical protein
MPLQNKTVCNINLLHTSDVGLQTSEPQDDGYSNQHPEYHNAAERPLWPLSGLILHQVMATSKTCHGMARICDYKE